MRKLTWTERTHGEHGHRGSPEDSWQLLPLFHASKLPTSRGHTCLKHRCSWSISRLSTPASFRLTESLTPEPMLVLQLLTSSANGCGKKISFSRLRQWNQFGGPPPVLLLWDRKQPISNDFKADSRGTDTRHKCSASAVEL